LTTLFEQGAYDQLKAGQFRQCNDSFVKVCASNRPRASVSIAPMPKSRRVRRPTVALPVLGVDVGGVLIDRVAEGSDTSFFGDRPLETPAVPDAVAVIARLAAGPFADRVHLVSKAGPKIEQRTRAWLEHTGFYAATGLEPQNLHVVRNRADKEPVCRRLGVTHFVDDRISVLNHLVSVRCRYLFTGGLGSSPVPDPEDVPAGMLPVESWPRLEQMLLTSCRDWVRQ
jgi:hypothetical protein